MSMIGECDMTGKRNVELFQVKIEGTIMNVCKECVKYGEQINKPASFKTKQKFYSGPKGTDQNSFIVKDYAAKIKVARESRNLKQSELADKLNEKESLLHKIESNHMKPNFPLAKKIGKFLGIKLIETVDTNKSIPVSSSSSSEPLTMEAALLKAMKKK